MELLFLEGAAHPTSGPLHLLFPLPGMLSPQIPPCLPPSPTPQVTQTSSSYATSPSLPLGHFLPIYPVALCFFLAFNTIK